MKNITIIKKAAHGFNCMSLRRKILIACVFVNFIAILFMSALTYVNYYTSERQSMIRAAQEQNRQLVMSIDMLFGRIDEISMSIYSDVALNDDISALNLMLQGDMASQYAALELEVRITDRLKQYMFTAKNIFSGKLYVLNKAIYLNSEQGTLIPPDAFMKAGYWKSAEKAGGRLLFSPPYKQTFTQLPQPVQLITLSRTISDISIKHKKVDVGILALDMRADYFGQYMNEGSITPNSGVAIFDAQGNLAFATQGAEQMLSESLAKPQNYFVFSQAHDKSGYLVQTVLPKSDLFFSIRSTLISLVLLAALFLAIGVAISVFIAATITNPLQKLLDTMQLIGGGDLSARAPSLAQKDLSIITAQFNTMLDDIHNLIEKNYIIELKEKEAQLSALQMQINPHFLYNTLDTINWKIHALSTDEDKNCISTMISSLGNILRYSFTDTNKAVPLYEDISQIRNYLYIQSVRFEDKFKAYVMIDEATENVPIQKLLIQPLVENAILHGLENKQSGGVLIVRSYLQDDCLNIIVFDNGAGMPARLPRSSQNMLEQIPSGAGIGLCNVNERLLLTFGQGSGLRIRSRPGKYTTITISIPIKGVQ